MPVFLDPKDGDNPWGIRITNFQLGLARVTPEEAAYYSSGKGLEEALDTFSKISQNTRMRLPDDTIISGGDAPKLFTRESAKMAANKKSGIPEVTSSNQITMYLEPANSRGKKGGINDLFLPNDFTKKVDPSGTKARGCNTCGYNTKGCTEACLAESGRMRFERAHIARRARTDLGLYFPAMFWGVMNHEISEFDKENKGIDKKTGKPRNLTTLVRTGGTHEGLFQAMQASESSELARPDIKKIEYTKVQSGDVVNPKQFYPANYPNTTFATSVTEKTTAARMKQASEEQGQVLATPFNRAPHSRYPESITLVDPQGGRYEGPTLRAPLTATTKVRGETLGDATDDRSSDFAVTGIRGGILPLGAKAVAERDEETGKVQMNVSDNTFIREVDPSRQIAAYQRSGQWKGEESVPSPRRRSR